jgi:hypothetical protein
LLALPLDSYTGGVEHPEAGPPGLGTGDGGAADVSESDAGALYRDAVLSDRPLLYLRFEEASGTSTTDEVRNLVATHDRATTGVAGLFPRSRAIAYTSGSNGSTQLASEGFRFPGSTASSFEVWTKAGSFKDSQWIGGTESPTSPRNGWSVSISADGRLHYDVWDPSAAMNVRSATCDDCSIVAGRFQHIVVSFDGQDVRFYVDGNLIERAFGEVAAAPAGGDLLLFGCRRVPVAGVEDCLDDWVLDELALYDYPLTQTRIKAHYDLGRPP